MDNNETYDYEDYQDLGGDDLSTTSFADGDLTSGAATGAAAGGLAAFSATTVILALVMLILVFVAKIKIFIKAGRQWWKAIIPVYRDYCMFQIAQMPGWLALLPFLDILLLCIAVITGAGALISGSVAAGGLAAILLPATSIVSIAFNIVLIIQNFKLAKAFGHGVGFGFGLWLLSPIFYMILAFGKSEYEYDDYDAGSTGDGNDDGGFGGYDNSFNDGGTPAGTPDDTAGGGYQNMQDGYNQYAQPDYSQYNQPQDYQNQGYGQYGQAQDYGQYSQYGQTGQPSQPVQYDNNGLASATLPQNQQTPSYNDFYGQGTNGMQATPDNYGQGTNGMQSTPDSYGQGTNGMQPTPDNYGQGTTGIQTAPDSYSQSTSGMQSTPDNYGQGTSGMQSSPDGYGQGTSGMQSNPGNYGQGMTQPDAGGYNAYGYQQPQMSQGQFNAPYGSQGSYGYNGYANGFDNGSNSNQQ